MDTIAQTNVQLYNQLRHQGRSTEELALVKRCYQLAVSLYSGHFQADGKPFVAHSTGVASIVAQLGLRAEIVGAALIHNIYGNGDFGDALFHTASPRRRRIARAAVGIEVEECVNRFRSLRLTDKSMLDIPARLDELDARDKDLITMELADILEKHADFGVLYFGDHRWVTGFVESHGEVLIEIAHRLGHPQLGDALRTAFATTPSESIPEVLRSPAHVKHMQLVVPRSCRLRLNVATILALSRLKRMALSRVGGATR